MSYHSNAHEIDDPVISIGVLAQRVGLSVSAVRRYENEGLIIAHRTGSGRRLFSHQDISRIQNIQRMIQDSGLNIEGILRMQALLPCWDLLPCSAETCKSCSAYAADTQPCWMVKGRACTAEESECRQCDVYRLGSLCTEEIKKLLHDQTDTQDSCTAVRELMDRKRRSREES